MNILFIYSKMFNPTTGGIERVTDLLCREFKHHGHNVAYLNNASDSSDGGYAYPAPIYFFPDNRTGNDAETPKNIDFYNRLLIKCDIDIVINQDLLFYEEIITAATIPAKTKVIAVLHSNPLYQFSNCLHAVIARNVKPIPLLRDLKWTYIKRQAMLKKLRAIYSHTIPSLDAFCMLSMAYLPELKKVYNGSTNNVVAIANPNTFAIQKNIDISMKKKQLLYVGRLDPYQKRVDRLITIWRHIYNDFKDWELVILGEGPQLNELKQMASGLERVTFAGRQNSEPYYRDASILCLTSDYEGWGMVLTEAMTFGTVPVLFNSYRAAPEIVHDGSIGMLVKPFSIRQYVEKLRILMNNADLRNKMALNAIEYVKRYDISNIANRWEKLFNRLKSPATE